MIIAFVADVAFHATVTQFIFDGFLMLAIGSLGITGVETFANRTTKTITDKKVQADVKVETDE